MEAGDKRAADESLTRLRHLQSISEAALAHLEFDDLVRELLDRVTAILDADTAAVLMLDEDTGELRARAAKGIEEEVEAEVRIPLGRGFAGRVAAERRVIFVPDVGDFDIVNPILREKGLRSLLGAPLLVQGRVIGVLHVGTLQPRVFTGDDSELLQLTADRIAVAIDHVRLYEAEHEARVRAEATADQLARLESITEAALAHLGLDELLAALLVRLRDLIGTDTVAVLLVEGNRHELVTRAALGLDDWLAQEVRMTLGEGFSGQIAAEARPQMLEDVQSAPPGTTAFQSSGVRGLLGVPLVVSGRVIGVLTAGTWEPRAFGDDDVALLQRAGDRIALAIEHARLFDAERAARARAELAAERIRRIESITEVALHHIAVDDEVLERLLSRVRVVLNADTAGLFIADDLTQVLVARAPDGVNEVVERGVSVPAGGGFAGLVAERREPVIVDHVDQIDIVSPVLQEAKLTSLLGVPLELEGRLLGVLHIGTVAERAFGAEELALLELAGERLAVALDRSRMYEREHFVAATLQRSLLPESLPAVQGATVASRYLPGEGEAVGGDWYDVIPLGDGRVALAMGDVVSRGVRAASVMGQLRNSLRAYALESYEPAALLERLHSVARAMEGHEIATLVYAVFDPAPGSIVYATAGHPPPVIARPDGEAILLEDGRGPPLGAIPGSIYAEARTHLGPAETLLLYTDGIVERRNMWVDEGIERLRAEVEAASDLEAEALVDLLLERLLPEGVTDDVALLALRTDPAPVGRFSMTLPADPTVLVVMRRALRRWLGEVGAGEDDAYDVLVATTEAAANAVEHAYGPGDATFEVEARSDDRGRITVTVRDRGSWRPPRGRNRGRGTLLMQELMDDFEVATGESGTEVRMCKRLAEAVRA